VRPLPEEAEPEPTASPSPEEIFLNSEEGLAFQEVSYQAAKAMLRANMEELSACMVDPSEAERAIRNQADIFDDIEDLTLSWNMDSIQSETEINASYRYLITGEDSYWYVSMGLVKIEGIWKVEWIGIEK
jgi:hypothetical protein